MRSADGRRWTSGVECQKMSPLVQPIDVGQFVWWVERSAILTVRSQRNDASGPLSERGLGHIALRARRIFSSFYELNTEVCASSMFAF